METLVPLPVVVPLIAAATLAAGSRWLGRRADDAIAVATAAATSVISTVLVVRSLDHDLV